MKISFIFLYTIIFFISILIKSMKQDDVESQDEIDEPIHHDEHESIEDNDNEEEVNTFSEEWERSMSDYEPAYVYMIPIKPKKTEKFYEEITKVPSKVRGAFLSDENQKDKIEFTILGPGQKIMYKNFTNECIFDFEVTKPGPYLIKFRNPVSKQEVKVTFTMNSYQDQILVKEHMNFTEEKIVSLSKFMDSIKLEKDMLKSKLKHRRKSKFFSIFDLHCFKK
jgi:hypothetical protein